MNDVTNGTIWSFILIAIITIDAFITLLTMLNKGIFIDRRKQLMSKTNKELKQLLVGVKNIHIKKALKNYIGVKRRFTYLGSLNLSNIYDH